MEFNQYQEKALEFALFDTKPALKDHLGVANPWDSTAIDYALSALPEEVGELSGIFAKARRKGQGRALSAQQVSHLFSELGDVLWNLSLIAHLYGIDLENVALYNVAKLENRKMHGKIEGSGEKIEDR